VEEKTGYSLSAQLFGRVRRIGGNRFPRFGQRRHRLPEGARGHDAFAERLIYLPARRDLELLDQG
jgi:hypothetical protein